MRKLTTIKIVLLIGILLVILVPVKSYAVLQANGGSVTSYNIATWINYVRTMENFGCALGKEEVLDTSNTEGKRYLPTTGNNGLDCHMEKNTEYGAMAILSASAYGNPTKINSGETTTGNATGVLISLNQEIVAGGTLGSIDNYKNADRRYKNIYTTTYQYIPGDAIGGMGGWHGGNTTWLSSNDSTILRAYGSIFGYYGKHYGTNGVGGAWNEPAHYSKTHPTRAVVVMGENF